MDKVQGEARSGMKGPDLDQFINSEGDCVVANQVCMALPPLGHVWRVLSPQSSGCLQAIGPGPT